MAGRKILITAGPTKEPIDPVRFISNASTGKMGLALTDAALKAGCSVTLITSLAEVKPRKDLEIIHVTSAKQMTWAVKKHFAGCDCLIMAAAVADYTPAKVSKTKLKKTPEKLTIELKPTTDILKWAGKNKKQGQFLVGFALEDKAIKIRAEKKMVEKNLDMIIANAPSAIGADSSKLFIKRKNSDWLTLPETKKTIAAKKIIKMISQS